MKNMIWISLLILVALLAIWFIVKSSLAICTYFQYSAQMPATIEKWSVEEIKTDQFAVLAQYKYFFKGNTFQGSGEVGNRYPNPWSANTAQKLFAKQKWTTWVNPRHPEKSVLEKKFPYKKAISAAILLALFIYFAILGTYVRIRHGR